MEQRQSMHLTPREREIVRELLLSARKREAVAADLEISPRTVRFHLDNLRRKLGVQTTLEVAMYFAVRVHEVDPQLHLPFMTAATTAS
jgi:DNA-binding CsgD family transcriptional regulator